jgi:hypothetical protein
LCESHCASQCDAGASAYECIELENKNEDPFYTVNGSSCARQKQNGNIP